jgi:hypothetical protein
MKFQSLIASIMHGFRLPTRAVVFLACLVSLNSCVSLIAKKNTYDASASSPAVTVNGASIRMQVKPEGTTAGSYALSAMVVSTAVATFDGPFRWRLEATGEAEKQQYFVIHKIRTRTEKTKRDEWYPASFLGRRADFKAVKNAAATRAIYPIPGLLKVKPKEDGALEVLVDLTVVGKSRNERKLVRFRMDPTQKRGDEFIFVPTEIVKNIGKTPADWEDQGWN